MYILYLDESGNENDPADRFFVLGGIAMFERQTYFLNEKLDQVQEKLFPGHQPVPFHASEIRTAKNFWRQVDPALRAAVIPEITSAIQSCHDRGRILFAAAI